MSHQIKDQRPVLPALTGIRFFAAFAVFSYHFASPTNAYLKTANSHGFVGVSLFFILSGFILAYTYVDEQGALRGTRRLFWAARFARIYPMYLVAFVIMTPVVFAWSKSGHVWLSGVTALTMTQAWLGGSEWNPPGWSISAELVFYLAFPFVVRPLSRLKTRAFLIILPTLWALSSAASVHYVFTGAVDVGFWLYNPLVRTPEFLTGVVVGIWWLRSGKHAKIPSFTAETSLAILLAVLCIPLADAYLMNGVLMPLFTALIVGLASGQGRLARLLGHRSIVLLGGASFSLYIIHWPFWYEAQGIVSRLLPDSSRLASFWIITVFGLIPASIACFKWIEEPCNRYLRKKFNGYLTVPPPEVNSHTARRPGNHDTDQSRSLSSH